MTVEPSLNPLPLIDTSVPPLLGPDFGWIELTSGGPCAMLAKDQTAPVVVPSLLPPMSADIPSPESATLEPNQPLAISPPPSTLCPAWEKVEPERVMSHAAPTRLASAGAPTRTALASPEIATVVPNWPSPASSEPPVRICGAVALKLPPSPWVKTYAAPTPPSYPGAPTTAVSPATPTL